MPIERKITLLLYFLVPFCLIDSLNGFLIQSLNIHAPISVAYKIVILLTAILLAVNSPVVLISLLWIVITVTYQSLMYNSNIIVDIGSAVKTLLFITLSFAGFRYRYYFTINHLNLIKKIFLFNFVVVVVNVFSGLIGIGYTTYDSLPALGNIGYGFKGYYYAGNELGVLLLAFYPIIYDLFKSSKIKILVCNLCFLLTGILIGTKSAALATVLVMLYSMFFLAKKNILIRLMFITAIAFIPIIFSSLIYDYFEVFINKYNYIYDQKGWMGVIFSGRDQYLVLLLDYVSNNFSAYDFIFGLGLFQAINSFKSVEVDIFDMGIWNGIPWSFFVYIYFIWYFFEIRKYSKNNLVKITSFVLVLIFFISFIAGHVFTSAMLLPFISLYIPYIQLNSFKEHE